MEPKTVMNKQNQNSDERLAIAVFKALVITMALLMIPTVYCLFAFGLGAPTTQSLGTIGVALGILLFVVYEQLPNGH